MMKAYQSYKDSGVEWIGEIPSGWSFGEMKYQLSNNDGGVWGSDVEKGNEGTLVIRSTEITIDGNWDLTNPMKRKLDEDEIKKCKLFNGDIVITKSSGSPDHIGKSVIVNENVESLGCCYSNFVQRIRFSNYSPELYHYILNSYVVREQYRYLTRSTTGLGNLNGSTLNEVQLPFIPLAEQTQIVKYLDQQTKKIDGLIEKTEKKIALLKEKRIALINHCVTKGLNPDVEMKDSGVEWIGEIPSGWNVLNGSYIGSYSKGKGIKKDEVVEVGNPCVRYGEIYTKYELKIDSMFSFISDETTTNSVSVRAGTLLLTGSGETKKEIGKCVVYLGDEILWVGGDIIVLKPSKQIDSLFLSYLINSECIRVQREMSGKGEIIAHIYSKNFKEMKYPIPSLSEQTKIVKYLDQQTQNIDFTINKETQRIALLKEYRQALISEVVTGKVDVRGWCQ
ncbi:Type I restriction-modification system, specificity subunit S [uncultured Candidatus Thioglobus sp.]|nr:Type I restriction-modification system, specificity subunit S [uncultured Candidatus Thioglobus sp.]